MKTGWRAGEGEEMKKLRFGGGMSRVGMSDGSKGAEGRGRFGMFRGVRPSRRALSVFVMILCVSIAMPTMVFAHTGSSPAQGDVDIAPGVSGPEGLRTTGAAIPADEQTFEWGGGAA